MIPLHFIEYYNRDMLLFFGEIITMSFLNLLRRKVEKRRRKFNFMRGRGQAEATDHPYVTALSS